MKTKKTRSGWIIEINNTGVRGKEILYKKETLIKHGINYNMDPENDDISRGNSNAAWLHHCIMPDKVIKAGHGIQ